MITPNQTGLRKVYILCEANTKGIFAWFWALVRKLFGWQVNHAALLIDHPEHGWSVYEAAELGIIRTSWVDDRMGTVYYKQYKNALEEWEFYIVCDMCDDAEGTPYAFLMLLSAARFWWWQRTQQDRFQAQAAPLYHCSGFVADVSVAISKPLSDMNALYVSPQMILDENIFTEKPQWPY